LHNRRRNTLVILSVYRTAERRTAVTS